MKKIFSKLGRTGAIVIVLFVICAVYTVRLIDWQVVQVDAYRKIAADQSSTFTKLPAVRGEILDKDGNVMAGNRITYSVNLVYQKMEKKNGKIQPNDILLKIVDLLEECEEDWKDELPIYIDADGNYAFDEERPKEIEYMKSAAMLKVQSYATADECMKELVNRFNCGGYNKVTTRNLASLRYSMVKNGFGFSTPFMIAGDVSQDTLGKINERINDMPGIETDIAVTRYYGEDGSLAPHTVGRVGAISEDDYNAYKENAEVYDSRKENVEAYTVDDRHGESGLERAYESVLRGLNGKEVITLDSQGGVASSVITQSPKAGNTIYTTIDSKLQEIANNSLEEKIREIRSKPDVKGTVTGSVVVLDIEDFGVLVSSNYPNYDMNKYNSDSDYIKELLDDEVNKPLFNRAIQGSYVPGSVFKPLVAIAALETGTINLSTTYKCETRFTHYAYAGYAPNCLGYHGNQEVTNAIANSCNIFFYYTGMELGLDNLTPYAEYFGLGQKTGVEEKLNERSGSMTNREDYRINHGAEFTEGVMIQVAIGQADNAFTPIQLATFMATIANDGKRLKTHYLSKISDYTGEHTIEEYEPVELYDAEISQTTLNAVKYGMRKVASDGTARIFANYEIPIAAKTGTAETSADGSKSDNSTFIAYAPYDNPEIAIAVVIEHAGKGTYAQEIARDVFDEYFGIDRKSSEDEDPEGEPEKTPEPEQSPEPEDGANMKPGTFYIPDADKATPAPDESQNSESGE